MGKLELILCRDHLNELQFIAQNEFDKGAQWMRISPTLGLNLIELSLAWLDLFQRNHALDLEFASPIDADTKDIR